MKQIPVGRFAPSPTGHLHLGSLVAATASYLNVKAHHGRWWVRIDDLDTPRVVAGSADDILRTLTAFGFEWDDIIWQSKRLSTYQDAITTLSTQQDTYFCRCSRAMIEHRTQQSGLYDNHCRNKSYHDQSHSSIRLIMPDAQDSWTDRIQGQQSTPLSSHGDTIIRRADGLFAYHLACAIDDGNTGITEVIRGVDLLTATPIQRFIQSRLNLQTPCYAHHPLIQAQGIKLSKATAAPPLNPAQSTTQLCQVLRLLGQAPPQDLDQHPLQDVWQWAIRHWQFAHIPTSSAFKAHET